MPACSDCNNTWSIEDEYFRLMIYLHEEVSEQPALQSTVRPAVERSLQRPDKIGMRKALFASMHDRHVVTEDGVDRGILPAYHVDFDRINRVAARTVIGLYFHETRALLPPGFGAVAFELGSYSGEPRRRMLEAATVVDGLPWKSIAGGLFKYRVRDFRGEAPHRTAWELLFYGVVRFLAITVPDSTSQAQAWRNVVKTGVD